MILKKKSFVTHFYGWGSTASRLQTRRQFTFWSRELLEYWICCKKIKKKKWKIFKLVFILLIQLIASFPGQIKFNKPNLSFSSYWTLVANACKIDNFSSFIIVYYKSNVWECSIFLIFWKIMSWFEVLAKRNEEKIKEQS